MRRGYFDEPFCHAIKYPFSSVCSLFCCLKCEVVIKLETGQECLTFQVTAYLRDGVFCTCSQTSAFVHATFSLAEFMQDVCQQFKRSYGVGT